MVSELRELLYLDKAELGESSLSVIRNDLVVVADTFKAEDSFEIKCYKESDKTIGVPIAYGINLCNKLGINYLDKTVKGFNIGVYKFPDPNHPQAPKEQKTFIADLMHSLKNHYGTLAIAATASGKTIAALYCAGKLDVNLCVIVPLKRLAEQWKEEAVKHLGLEPADIKIVDGSSRKYKGAKIVIVTGQTAAGDKLPEDFYNYFGMVVTDENHRAGAQKYSKCIFKFNSRYKLALSATPLRSDGTHKAYYLHLAHDIVESNSKVLPCDITVIEKTFKGKVYGKKWGAKVESLRTDKSREALAIKLIYSNYINGNNILVLSDSTKQLYTISRALRKSGVPYKKVGLFCASINLGKKTVTVPKAEQERVFNECQIILATFGMMKEGISIPRLNVGMDLTPYNDGIQTIGRVRRLYPGKKISKWYTFLDIGYAFFHKITMKKISGWLEKEGVTVRYVNGDGYV